FRAPLTWVGWTLTGYQLVQIIMLPLAGRLSDTLGRKRVFLACTAAFTLGSLLCGLAPSIGFLIGFRALQALGGGGLMPSAIGIISDQFGDRRAQARGLFSSVFPIGGIIGPNLGGFIVDNLSWRWIFFVNIPLGILLLVGGLLVLPQYARSHEHNKLDLTGAAMFAAGIFSVLFAMTTLANHPHNLANPMVWGFLALGILLLIVFLRHEGRVPAPMVELELLRWRPFFAANVYNFIYGACVFGLFSFIPFYAHDVYGLSAGDTGLLLTPRSIVMAVTSTISSFFLIRFGYRLPMIFGAVIISITFAILSQGFHDVSLLGFHPSNMTLLALIVMIAGFGIGIAGPASNNTALDLVPEKISAVAGIRGMFRSTGGVLGTAAIPLALSQFNDKAQGWQAIFTVLIFVILLIVPLVFLIPDMARQRHLARRDAVRAAVPEAAGPIEL
ncbi:MAG TPA: MFS transporter, partial [Dehalococcoidia bacterium]|nr:MFS transporter [Dehalococcoidia bacterium]